MRPQGHTGPKSPCAQGRGTWDPGCQGLTERPRLCQGDAWVAKPCRRLGRPANWAKHKAIEGARGQAISAAGVTVGEGPSALDRRTLQRLLQYRVDKPTGSRKEEEEGKTWRDGAKETQTPLWSITEGGGKQEPELARGSPRLGERGKDAIKNTRAPCVYVVGMGEG